MAPERACTAVFQIPELCAYIIDFLYRSTEDLKSCALVCQKFTHPAQLHLFNHINLCFVSSSARFQGIPGDEAGALLFVAHRLRETLDAAPHLRPLVRSAAVKFELPLLTQFAEMDLPCLNHLEMFGRNPSSTALGVAQSLIALPSIQSLDLNVTFSSCADLAQLFARCTPTLSTLELFRFQISAGADGPVPQDIGPRTQIRNLRLLETSPDVASWFLDPHSPLDLSHLRHVHIFKPKSPALVLLLPSRATIEELRVNAQDITPNLPLAAFPLLRKLWLVGNPSTLLNAIVSLPACSDRLEAIMLSTYNPDIAIESLALIDAHLASLHLPVLAYVEMSVPRRRSAPDPDAFETTRAELMRAFARMEARGFFEVNKFPGFA